MRQQVEQSVACEISRDIHSKVGRDKIVDQQGMVIIAAPCPDQLQQDTVLLIAYALHAGGRQRIA
jgi:hypothetical protein